MPTNVNGYPCTTVCITSFLSVLYTWIVANVQSTSKDGYTDSYPAFLGCFLFFELRPSPGTAVNFFYPDREHREIMSWEMRLRSGVVSGSSNWPRGNPLRIWLELAWVAVNGACKRSNSPQPWEEIQVKSGGRDTRRWSTHTLHLQIWFFSILKSICALNRHWNCAKCMPTAN